MDAVPFLLRKVEDRGVRVDARVGDQDVRPAGCCIDLFEHTRHGPGITHVGRVASPRDLCVAECGARPRDPRLGEVVEGNPRPAPPKASAMANPRPVAPPVTRTVWPSNRNAAATIMLPLSRLEAAVDVDRLPIDVGGVRRDEEGDDGGDLRSRAVTPERNACSDGVTEVSAASSVASARRRSATQCISVSMLPGLTQFTRMPYVPSSRAAWVRATMPAFEAP